MRNTQQMLATSLIYTQLTHNPWGKVLEANYDRKCTTWGQDGVTWGHEEGLLSH